MFTYKVYLQSAAEKIFSVTDVPALEAEILLAHVLNKPRSYLYARLNEEAPPAIAAEFQVLVERRVTGEPIAYIVGHKEFWSMKLTVNKDVLIPRPETELLVELILMHQNHAHLRLADLGTGSGAIALALAKERLHWEAYATDQSKAALEVAKQNAEYHQIQNIQLMLGDWVQALPNIRFDVIVSNPPYLAENDQHLREGDLRFEPRMALIAPEDGLGAIRQIIFSAMPSLKNGGSLWLEHGCEQGEKVRNLLMEASYQAVTTYKDLAGHERVTMGIKL